MQVQSIKLKITSLLHKLCLNHVTTCTLNLLGVFVMNKCVQFVSKALQLKVIPEHIHKPLSHLQGSTNAHVSEPLSAILTVEN